MLASVVFRLRPLETGAVAWAGAAAVHGAFLKLVSRVNEDLAAELHQPDTIKPFTLSLLQGPVRREGNGLALDAGAIYWFRATSLTKELSDLLISVTPADLGEVPVGDIPCRVETVLTDPGLDPWARTASYDALWGEYMTSPDPVPSRFSLQFHSPTTFWSDDRSIPLPEPRRVFGSLAKKWNAFGPVNLGDAEEVLRKLVNLARHNIRTRVVPFGKPFQVGFVGTCQFEVCSKHDSIWTRVVPLLADFAFFAGVGYKTTMGMGQTVLVSAPDPGKSTGNSGG